MAAHTKRPDRGAGPSELLSCGGTGSDDNATFRAAQRKPCVDAVVYEADGVRVVPVKGRVAWALRNLIEAGSTGCTPIDTPGPRWSAYVHKLRQAGIHVETIHEHHGGPYSGRHARYCLRSKVALREPGDAGGRAA